VIKKKLSRVQKKKEKKPKTIKNINTIAHLKAAPTHVISPYGWDIFGSFCWGFFLFFSLVIVSVGFHCRGCEHRVFDTPCFVTMAAMNKTSSFCCFCLLDCFAGFYCFWEWHSNGSRHNDKRGKPQQKRQTTHIKPLQYKKMKRKIEHSRPFGKGNINSLRIALAL